MKKMLAVLCCLLLVFPAAAELPTTTFEDFFLFRPEAAQDIRVLWQSNSDWPRVVMLQIPETHRELAAEAMQASPVWRTDPEPWHAQSALSVLMRMGCTELPELPSDMLFEGVCFWVDGGVEFAAVDAEQATFLMMLVIGSVALGGPEAIDTSLRMGFFDQDTGMLLLATWAVE